MGRLVAGLVTFGLGIALGSGAWAQGNKDRDKENDRSDVITVRGVVAAVTAEGEMVVDYRTNRAVLAEAAYLTVVGSPAGGKDGDANAAKNPRDSDRKDKQQAKDKDKDKEQAKDKGKDDDSDDGRETVYIAWLSPRTKVYQASDDSGKSGKKEVSFDQIDVGEHVEIQFNPREETDADAGANQTEQMRRKHGRNRIVIGDAMAITILPSKDDDKSSPKDDDKSSPGKGDSGKRDRDK
jgi:hypothetical protein